MGSKPICVLGLFYHDLFVEIQVYFQSHISITVNSSPYAVEVYRHLGFTPTGGEQNIDGLRFTPMKYPGS